MLIEWYSVFVIDDSINLALPAQDRKIVTIAILLAVNRPALSSLENWRNKKNYFAWCDSEAASAFNLIVFYLKCDSGVSALCL